MHLNFDIDMIKIKIENPHRRDRDEGRSDQGSQLEIEYARDTMPRGVGMNAAMMRDYSS